MKGLLKRLGIGLALLTLVAVAAWGSAQMCEEWETVKTSVESGRQIVLENGRRVDLETFVLYLAAAQVPADYGAETLKCQTVIARTFLFREMGDAWELAAMNLGADYWDETVMRDAWGLDYEKNHQAFEVAVQSTAGQTLRYAGDYIAPVFHRLSIGNTRNAGEDFPYLQERNSSEDLLADGNLTVVEMTLGEATAKLAAKTGEELRSGEFWSKVQIVARDGAGYVEEVQVGTVKLRGDDIAMVLGLPSSCFSWEAWNGGVRIVCRGQGHGYGLSQWGARMREQTGSNYKEILQYYYPGVEIQ